MPVAELWELARTVADRTSGDDKIVDRAEPGDRPLFVVLNWRGLTKSSFEVDRLKGTGNGITSDLKFRVSWTSETANSIIKTTGDSIIALLIFRYAEGVPGFATYQKYLQALATEIRSRGGQASVRVD